MTPPLPTRDELFERMVSIGYTVGTLCCLACGEMSESAVKPGIKLTNLECPKCGQKRSLFYEFDSTTQPK